MAAQWMKDNSEGKELFFVCSDSQSLCVAQQSYNPGTDGTREMIKDFRGSVVIQWIQGHSMITGNSMAWPKDASNQIAPERPITLHSAKIDVQDLGSS